VVMSESGADWTEDFTQLTVMAWVKNDLIAIPADTYTYVSKGHMDNEQASFTLYKDSAESWNFDCAVSSASKTYLQSIYSSDVDLDWHHVVGVWNGSHLFLYVDGVSVGTSLPAFAGPFRDTAANVAIGASSSGNHEHNGSIDNVMIFNRALTPQEIIELYRNPFCMFQPELSISQLAAAYVGAPAAGGQVIIIGPF